MKFLFQTPIGLPVEKIKKHFNRELFIFISEGPMPFKHLRFDGCKKGDIIVFEIGPKGKFGLWESEITFEETNENGWSFIDEGKKLPWPISFWRHHHKVEKVSDEMSVIVDDVEFECSPGFMMKVMKPVLWMVFAHRPPRYKEFFKEMK